jgi:hypothetical protein
VEVMLLWADDLDDLLGAAAQLAAGLGYRLAPLGGIALAALAGLGIGVGAGITWG